MVQLRTKASVIETFPTTGYELYQLGVVRCIEFCQNNNLPFPKCRIVDLQRWPFGACAFYRPDTSDNREWLEGSNQFDTGINICLRVCGRACTQAERRNWSWPGNTTDREPYGVVCHELGHHVDWLTGDNKDRYWSDYCEHVKDRSREPGVSSYADVNPAEWLAEAFRLYVTNPDLLRELRPRTFRILFEKFKPTGYRKWHQALGKNVPLRVVENLRKKIAGK
jgi:hypothetical protein